MGRQYILYVAVLALVLVDVYGRGVFRGMFPKSYPPMLKNGVDPGQPLFLSPYLKKGDVNQGKIIDSV